MADSNHYETLKISNHASQAAIGLLNRRLVRVLHSDSNQETTDHQEIIPINAAYELLSDTQSRLNYDEELRNHQHYQENVHHSHHQKTASDQKHYQVKRQTGKDADEKVEEWLCLVYKPVNRILCVILNSLEEQIDQLAPDPFDDQLIDKFQEYLKVCREDLKKAHNTFRSLPNPPSLAKAAAHLYYSLSQVGDRLEELAYFPLNYNDRYLHTGQEMFRIATRLHCEGQESVNQ